MHHRRITCLPASLLPTGNTMSACLSSSDNFDHGRHLSLWNFGGKCLFSAHHSISPGDLFLIHDLNLTTSNCLLRFIIHTCMHTYIHTYIHNKIYTTHEDEAIPFIPAKLPCQDLDHICVV